jgi:flagellar FliJ protein
MNRLKRLAPIVELAATQEQEAAAALGASLRKLEEARLGMQSLEHFRASYGERFKQSGEQGLSMRQLAEYRAFLAKINQAIAEQEKVAQQMEAEAQRRRHAWEEAHRHSLGMQKLADKLRSEEAGLAQKREQAEMDERAGRRGRM